MSNEKPVSDWHGNLYFKIDSGAFPKTPLGEMRRRLVTRFGSHILDYVDYDETSDKRIILLVEFGSSSWGRIPGHLDNPGVGILFDGEPLFSQAGMRTDLLFNLMREFSPFFTVSDLIYRHLKRQPHFDGVLLRELDVLFCELAKPIPPPVDLDLEVLLEIVKLAKTMGDEEVDMEAVVLVAQQLSKMQFSRIWGFLGIILDFYLNPSVDLCLLFPEMIEAIYYLGRNSQEVIDATEDFIYKSTRVPHVDNLDIIREYVRHRPINRFFQRADLFSMDMILHRKLNFSSIHVSVCNIETFENLRELSFPEGREFLKDCITGLRLRTSQKLHLPGGSFFDWRAYCTIFPFHAFVHGKSKKVTLEILELCRKSQFIFENEFVGKCDDFWWKQCILEYCRPIIDNDPRIKSYLNDKTSLHQNF